MTANGYKCIGSGDKVNNATFEWFAVSCASIYSIIIIIIIMFFITIADKRCKGQSATSVTQDSTL